jgi:hypothetical protein
VKQAEGTACRATVQAARLLASDAAAVAPQVRLSSSQTTRRAWRSRGYPRSKRYGEIQNMIQTLVSVAELYRVSRDWPVATDWARKLAVSLLLAGLGTTCDRLSNERNRSATATNV